MADFGGARARRLPHGGPRLAGGQLSRRAAAIPRRRPTRRRSGAAARFEGSDDPQIVWLQRMAAKGWTAPTWPKEYGGGGLSASRGRVLRPGAERRINAAPPLASFGIWMLGPVLLEYANEEQKKSFLPEIVARRDPLVPGLFRAGRRLGPRRPADQVRGQGRPLADQRPEDLDQLRRQGRLDASASCAPTPRRSTRASRFVLIDMATPGRRDAADPADLRRLARSARPSSPT